MTTTTILLILTIHIHHQSASVHLVPVLKGQRERLRPGGTSLPPTLPGPRIRGGGGTKMTERQTDQQVNNGGRAGAGSEDKMDRGEGNHVGKWRTMVGMVMMNCPYLAPDALPPLSWAMALVVLET